jgi:uncharacterized protein (TIGR02246 family)
MVYRELVAAAALLALGAPVSAQAQTQGLSLEQRVQRIEDEVAIRALILKYAELLTARDFDGYVQLFAPDGVWQNGTIVHRGRADIKDMLVKMFPGTPPGYVNTDSYMVVSNVSVDLDPDGRHAHARARQLSIRRAKSGTPTPVLAGMYEDDLVKIDGEWKFSHRQDITLMPSMEQWQKKMAEGIQAPEG